MADEIAAQNGIAELTDRHWQVIDYMRTTYLETGSAPSIRSLGKLSGVPIKELYALFPKGPAKLAAKIAGHPQAPRLHLGGEHDHDRDPRPAARRGDRAAQDDREGRRSSSPRARWKASTPA